MKKKYKFCPLCANTLVFGNIEGFDRFFCRKCGWINYCNSLPSTACVVRNEKGEMLIIKRAIQPAINKWALPGGFIEGTENPERACLRELKEETGVIGRVKRLVGVYLHKSSLYGPILVIGYEVELLKSTVAVSSEVKEVKFFSRKNLPHLCFLNHRKIIEEVFRNKA